MLIIFDLDDTLVDTFRCLTLPKLKESLIHMIQGGLKLDCSFERAWADLKRCNVEAKDSKEALSSFLPDFKNGELFLEQSIAYVYESSDEGLNLKPVLGAIEGLKKLKKKHTLACVTKGFRGRQLRKLEKAGIDWALFSKIVVTQSSSKKVSYQKVLRECGFSPEETLVCGDKFDVDLEPAKRMGCLVAHAQWGHRKSAPRSGFKSDICAKNFEEILTFIEQLHGR